VGAAAGLFKMMRPINKVRFSLPINLSRESFAKGGIFQQVLGLMLDAESSS
jgi:hypothetical protein